jgi:uncharacterized protein YacL
MKIVCGFLGGLLGYAIALPLDDLIVSQPGYRQLIPNTPGIIIVFALVGFLIASVAYRSLLKFNNWFLKLIIQSNGPRLVSGVLGGALGFALAIVINMYFIETIFSPLPISYVGLKFMAFVGVIVILVYLGAFFLSSVKIGVSSDDGGTAALAPKVLDTNIIIDGRISDIIKSKFLEGLIIVPHSVLKELQKLADSADTLKRNRGRLGLDHLKKIQEDPEISIEIYDDFSEPDEDTFDVDAHLVNIAKKIGGKIITNDYNLNKVAVLQGMDVLNINELANALKPVYLPGEEFKVQIIKHGKETGQGVAYLDDGTMIVVEGGDGFIGKDIIVSVTSVLQTVAGRLIFAKPSREM